MKITHISSECAPFAKSGGLGDVVYGLTRMTNQKGIECDVIIPNYKSNGDKTTKQLVDTFNLSFDREDFTIQVFKTNFHDVPVYTIDSTCSRNLFSRNAIYGEEDDTHRFLCFSYFALAFISRNKIRFPNILHLHDWPTGFCGAFLKFSFPDLHKKLLGIVFTIHNLKHQGICKKEQLAYFNIQPENVPLSYNQIDNPNYFNITKAAIEEADRCVVVSPTYLKEIQTSIFGEGLEHFIKEKNYKFKAILNGIDIDYWNPEKDPYLHRTYRSHGLIDEVIEAKYRNKHYLQKHLKLESSHKPLFIFITRLVEQKGPHLIIEAIKHLLKQGAQAILLGSEPSFEIKESFSKLHSSQSLYIDFRFQEGLSHLCYAAADAIIIPSIYEPCGLTQMIAMRYGTVPIVRQTGGLSDTVFDIEHSNVPKNIRNGLVFEFPTLDSMDYIVTRAIKIFNEEHDTWKIMMKNGLLADFSFDKPTDAYISLYQSITF